MMARIGIIGKKGLTNRERAKLNYIGQCMALAGHTLITSQDNGTAHAVALGFLERGGNRESVSNNVIAESDFVIAYVNKTFMLEAQKAYPDFADRPDVAVAWPEDLEAWVSAMQTVLQDKNVDHP